MTQDSQTLDLAEKLREAGVVDTHFHVGPELVRRRYDVGELADLSDPRYRANAFDWHPGAALHAVVAPALAEVVLKAATN